MKYIKHKINRLSLRIDSFLAKTKVLFELMQVNGKTIFLFGFPIHANMGDQAQAFCTLKWLNENYPDYKVFTFNWKTSYSLSYKLLRKKIGKDDLLFGHSGYFFYDHHLELRVYREIADLFPDYRFVIMPQTINILDNVILEKTVKSLNAHPNITLLCRDEISYENAKKNFPNCKLLLYPDIVTSLIGKREYSNKRDGILFVLRDDLEKFYSSDQIMELRNRFIGISKTEIMDTSINLSNYEMKKNREKLLNDMLEKFSHFKVIITDRYHGTIFSLITSTPVIVLDSSDHKLSSGVKWFPESFNKHVFFARNLDQAYEFATNVLSSETTYKLDPYFDENYYSKLLSKL
jgi:exopolysaccharide biosynthesis predicted pyruvyltransferase EpsI